MSHTATIKGIKITDIAALTSAIAELNTSGIKMSLIPNATPRAYYPNQVGMGPADFVIKLEGARFDIGLYKQADGSYEPRTDFWMGEVEKLIGVKPMSKEAADQAKLGKLTQMYGIHAATIKARKQGLTIRRVPGKDGAIKLVVAGFA